MKKTNIVLAILVIALTSVRPVNAAPVTYTFSGTVTTFLESADSPILDGSVAVGVTLSGQYTFDTMTPNTTPGNPEEGNYFPSGPPLTMNVGNYQLTASFKIEVVNNRFDLDSFRIRTLGGANKGIFTNGIDTFAPGSPIGEVDSWDTVLFDDDETVFSSTALPLILPVLSNFERRDFTMALRFGGVGDGTIIRSTIDTLELVPAPTIPEPGTLALFGLGLVGLARLRRKACCQHPPVPQLNH